MKKSLLIFILICTFTALSSDFKKNGTAGFVFLELPVTARSVGMGECSVSLSDMDAGAAFTNPGGLGFSNLTYSLSSSYADWFADIKNYGLSGAWKTDYGVFAISSIMLDYGSIPRTVKVPGQRLYEQDGTFSANSLSLGLSYSKQLTQKFSFGVTVKYVNEKIDVYNASNVLFDGGMIYYTGLSSLRIGAVLQNFGTNSKFINSTFKMPSIFKIGAAAEIIKNDNTVLTAIIEAIHPTDSDEKLNAGLEAELIKMVFLRAGYKFFHDEETYTLGLGFKPTASLPVSFDFSYAASGRLGNLMRFSLQVGME